MCGSRPEPEVVTMSPGTSCSSTSGCSCRHMSKKVDWISLPVVTGSMVVDDLPSAAVFVTAERDLPGFSFEKVSKITTARSDGEGFWLSGLSVLNFATTSGCDFSQSNRYCCWG